MIKKKKKKITTGFNIGEMVVYHSHGFGQINTSTNYHEINIGFAAYEIFGKKAK